LTITDNGIPSQLSTTLDGTGVIPRFPAPANVTTPQNPAPAPANTIAPRNPAPTNNTAPHN
jgi:hypothetical protein